MATKTYPHMTREQWLQWADALDSGEYTQVRHRLIGAAAGGEEDWSRACCLGVCTVVMRGKDWNYPESLGLMTGSQQDRFVVLNDDQRRSFTEIASVIRENLDTLAAGEVPTLAGAAS